MTLSIGERTVVGRSGVLRVLLVCVLGNRHFVGPRGVLVLGDEGCPILVEDLAGFQILKVRVGLVEILHVGLEFIVRKVFPMNSFNGELKQRSNEEREHTNKKDLVKKQL